MFWQINRDERGSVSVTLVGDTNRCPVTKRVWWYGFEYQPYQCRFLRTTRADENRRFPEKIEAVVLVNQTRGSLLQPKDWGFKHYTLWTKRGTAVGCTSGNDLLDWPDIKGLREWFLTFTAMIDTAVQEDQFNPVADWLTETTSVVQPLFTGPGVLP